MGSSFLSLVYYTTNAFVFIQLAKGTDEKVLERDVRELHRQKFKRRSRYFTQDKPAMMGESNRAPLLDSAEQCRECVFKLGIIFFLPSTTHFDGEGEKGEGGREREMLSTTPMIMMMAMRRVVSWKKGISEVQAAAKELL